MNAMHVTNLTPIQNIQNIPNAQPETAAMTAQTNTTKSTNRFDRLTRFTDRVAVVPAVTLGDPTSEASVEVLRAVIRAGADALSVTLPFSDPCATRPTARMLRCEPWKPGLTWSSRSTSCARSATNIRTSPSC